MAESVVSSGETAPEQSTPSERSSRPTRDRKSVTMYVPEVKEVEDKPLVVPQGAGKPLGEIVNVKKRLESYKLNDPFLKKVHALLYPGQRNLKKNLKKNIGLFKGFGEDGLDEARTAASERLEKFEVAKGLKPMCMLFDVDARGTKEQLIDRIVDYLCKPEESGKDYQTKKGAKRKTSTKKTSTKKKKIKKAKEPNV